MPKLILTVLLVVAGCATQGPKVVDGTESAVVVSWYESTQGTKGALSAAEAHCQKYDKHAQYVGKEDDFKIAYNCVK